MRKKALTLVAVVAIFISLTAVCWFFEPIELSKHDAEDISYIKVYVGRSGESFMISNRESVDYIVNTIKNVCLIKTFRSGKHVKGYVFSLKFFLEEDGSLIDEVYIISEKVLRKDSVIYNAVCGELCFDYLTLLENQLSQANEGDRPL